MARFLAVFLAVLVGLFAAELSHPVQEAIVLPWTEALARISSGLVSAFDSQVVSHGKVLQSTRNGFAVSIEAGCNGIEASLILIASILAFPATWKQRAAGAAAGLVAIQVLNIVRLVSLFYLGQWSLRAFEWAHLYIWQALIMLDALVVWLLWVRHIGRVPAPVGNAAA